MSIIVLNIYPQPPRDVLHPKNVVNNLPEMSECTQSDMGNGNMRFLMNI